MDELFDDPEFPELPEKAMRHSTASRYTQDDEYPGAWNARSQFSFIAVAQTWTWENSEADDST
jgi:hypothetical protein